MDTPLRSIANATPTTRVTPRQKSGERRGGDQRFARELEQSGAPASERARPEAVPAPAPSVARELGSTLDVVA